MGGRGGRRGTGGNKKKWKNRNKRGVYFCRVTTLRSLVDVRSGIYKTKAGGSTANKLRLSPDRWVINKRRRRLRRKHTPGKLKWDMWRDGHSFPMTPSVWRFIPTVSSVSWTPMASLLSCFPPKCWNTFSWHWGRCNLAAVCDRSAPPSPLMHDGKLSFSKEAFFIHHITEVSQLGQGDNNDLEPQHGLSSY